MVNQLLRLLSLPKVSMVTWLVVYLPLWKIWVHQLGSVYSQYMESHKIPWFQSPPTRHKKRDWVNTHLSHLRVFIALRVDPSINGCQVTIIYVCTSFSSGNNMFYSIITTRTNQPIIHHLVWLLGMHHFFHDPEDLDQWCFDHIEIWPENLL